MIEYDMMIAMLALTLFFTGRIVLKSDHHY